MLAERKPVLLHGVTSLPFHAERARARSTADVWCADAQEWLAARPEPVYNTVLALDCAYHFRSRASFFEAAHNAMVTGGTLGLVDLVGAWPYPAWTASDVPPPTRPPSLYARVMHYIACLFSGTDPGAFVYMEQYRAQLEAAGFTAVQITDISHNVFPGFSRFLCNLGSGDEHTWRSSTNLHAFRAFGRVVSRWAAGGNNGIVRCVLVTAHKPTRDT